MVVRTTKKRVVFSLSNFIEELESCVLNSERNIDIDDVVQEFKDFLSRVKDKSLLISIKNYTDSHPTLLKNKKVKSFVDCSYRDFL